MPAPEDVIRGVCEMIAMPALAKQHLEGIRVQNGEGLRADPGYPQRHGWNHMGARQNEHAPVIYLSPQHFTSVPLHPSLHTCYLSEVQEASS